MKRILFFCLLATAIFFSFRSFAQKEDYIWAFGYHSGLDFNSGTPTIINTQMNSMEGAAAVSNGAGQLLFYSNGETIWDANNNPMPNGTGIIGNGFPAASSFGIIGSSTQGVAIVPFPGSINRYYLFTLEANEDIYYNNSPGYLRYSIVDMALNNGLGDVVAGQKNIILDSFMTEKMQVASGASCVYWLLVHRYNSAAYHAYKIDANGINTTPVISNGASADIGVAGEMKFSPDFSKVAAIKEDDTTLAIELADFSNTTGIISNAHQINVPTSLPVLLYGIDFSPDGKKLYCGEWDTLAQFDLTLWPNVAAVEASHTAVYVVSQSQVFIRFNGMRRGPDNKLYVGWRDFTTPNSPGYIGCISNPDIAGTACNYNPTAIQVPTSMFFPNNGNHAGFGLGNRLVFNHQVDTVFQPTHVVTVCNDTGVLRFPGYDYCYWSTGTLADTNVVHQPGTYIAYGFADCAVHIDTFQVNFSDLSVHLGNDTSICKGDELHLNAETAGATYLWQNGSRNPDIIADAPGKYFVTVSRDDCQKSDTLIVNEITPALKLSSPDTLICSGNAFTLTANATPESSLLWNTGSTATTINIEEEGIYTVTATSICGTLSDSVKMDVENCNCPLFTPNAFSPNGDGLNDVFKVRIGCSTSYFDMNVFNRFGQRVFKSNNIEIGWDGTFNGKICDLDTYFYQLKYKGPDGKSFENKGDVILMR